MGIAAGYSMLIELARLVSFRGLFEFDDVIHNALGTASGQACTGPEADSARMTSSVTVYYFLEEKSSMRYNNIWV